MASFLFRNADDALNALDEAVEMDMDESTRASTLLTSLYAGTTEGFSKADFIWLCEKLEETYLIFPDEFMKLLWDLAEVLGTEKYCDTLEQAQSCLMYEQ
jgi:hypothetical protein